jgi:hypothetical protein
MIDRYTLIGQTPVPCEDLIEWAMWMETADRRVFYTEVGEYYVSTVFLGLDHSFGRFIGGGDGVPILFETMIFLSEASHMTGEPLADWTTRAAALRDAADQTLVDYQRRYATWTEAERGHEDAVALTEARTGTARTPAALEELIATTKEPLEKFLRDLPD